MIGRRGFLRLFGASAVGLAVAPQDLLWQRRGRLWVPTFTPPDVLTTLQGITRAMAQTIGLHLGPVKRLQMRAAGWRVGERSDGVMLTDQCYTEMEPLSPGRPYHYERYVLPAAMAMVNMLRHDGIKSVAPMCVPNNWPEFESALVTDEASGVSVRGLSCYDPQMDRQILRMDILGGRTA